MKVSAAVTATVKDKLLAISFSKCERRFIARWLDGAPGEYLCFYETPELERPNIHIDKGEAA